MFPLETESSILQDIKLAIAECLPTSEKGINTLAMTEDYRMSILNTLVAYADKIPHPASGFRPKTNTDQDKTAAINSDHSANSIVNGGRVVNGDSIVNDDQTAIDYIKHAQSQTLLRWQILAYVSGIDLTLAKWFESHLDALSILKEVGYDKPVQGLWAVWAAEGHPDPIHYQQGKISGTKAWCSGANIVNHALMTYRDDNGHSQLLIVDMHKNGKVQEGVTIDNSEWQAVGMQATDTATVQFKQVAATNVGVANDYLERVGFWHGAAGVAACWYGATLGISEYLIQSYQQKPNNYKAMYLGQVSTSLAVTQQYFHHVAELIDSQPNLSHELVIRQLRANVELLARQVLENVGQALGAAPFCGNAHFARLTADLTVFIRQSHAAFDLQKIGELASELSDHLSSNAISHLANRQDTLWQL